MERIEGPVALSRERGNRMAVAIANVDGRDLVGFVEEAARRSPSRSNCPPATGWNGAASSRTSSAPRRAWRWWCRWRWG
jgi:cobalt-zinc-cadmium resistance protein CzcA